MSEREIYETIYLLEDREDGGAWGLADDAEPLYPRDGAERVAARWVRESAEWREDEGSDRGPYEVRVVEYQRVAVRYRAAHGIEPGVLLEETP